MKTMGLVLIPGDSSDIYDAVDRLMAPFSYYLEVEEYETECDCIYDPVDELARAEATRIAGREADITYNETNPARAARRVALYAQSPRLSPEEEAELAILSQEFSTAYKEAHEPYNRAYWTAKERFSKLQLENRPNPDCERCGGTGRMKTTDNPNAHHDRWSLGWGMGDDHIPKRRPEAKVPRPNLDHLSSWQQWRERLRRELAASAERRAKDENHEDAVPVMELLDDSFSPLGHQVPRSVVTPDGQRFEFEPSHNMPSVFLQE